MLLKTFYSMFSFLKLTNFIDDNLNYISFISLFLHLIKWIVHHFGKPFLLDVFMQ